MRNPATGKSPIPEGRKHWGDRRAPTVILEKSQADAKTKLDMQHWRKLIAGEAVASNELGMEGGLARLVEAAAATKTTVPPGAAVAAIGQQDLLFCHPDVRKFATMPENNPLLGVSEAEIAAAVEAPVEVAPGALKSIAAPKDPGAKTLFKGNYTPASVPEASVGATAKAAVPLLLTFGWDYFRKMNDAKNGRNSQQNDRAISQ